MTEHYRIAGLRVRVDGRFRAAQDLYAERYAPFRAKPGRPDIWVEFECPDGYTNPLVAAGEIGLAPVVYGAAGPVAIHRTDYEGRFIEPDGFHVKLKMWDMLDALNGALRLLLTLYWPPRGGILIHGAGLRDSAGVVAISGPSGAGKTTACRHAPADLELLSDENVILVREGASAVCHGTPMVGELARPGSPSCGPLRALFFTEHAAENRISPLPAREIVRRLARNTHAFPSSPLAGRQTLDAIAGIAACVTAFRLEALADGSWWPAARAIAAGDRVAPAGTEAP